MHKVLGERELSRNGKASSAQIAFGKESLHAGNCAGSLAPFEASQRAHNVGLVIPILQTPWIVQLVSSHTGFEPQYA